MSDVQDSAANPKERVRLGSLLADIGRQAMLTDEEFAIFVRPRDRASAMCPSNYPAAFVEAPAGNTR